MFFWQDVVLYNLVFSFTDERLIKLHKVYNQIICRLNKTYCIRSAEHVHTTYSSPVPVKLYILYLLSTIFSDVPRRGAKVYFWHYLVRFHITHTQPTGSVHHWCSISCSFPKRNVFKFFLDKNIKKYLFLGRTYVVDKVLSKTKMFTLFNPCRKCGCRRYMVLDL